MGLKDGAKTLHSITGLTIEDVFKMCKGLTDEYGMDTPTIDVDCSNVCFCLFQGWQDCSLHYKSSNQMD